MRTLVVLNLGLCLTYGSGAKEFNPFEGPKPMVIFIQSDPWLMVIGSDTPRVAVYETGDVIFAKKREGTFVYRRFTLDKAGLDKVREKIRPVLALKDLKPFYNIRPNVTDEPEAMFYLREWRPGNRDICLWLDGTSYA